MILRAAGMREVGFWLPLMAEVSGEGQIEGIKRDYDEEPEDDLGGDGLLLDDLFVQIALVFEGSEGIAHGGLDAGMAGGGEGQRPASALCQR